jgi:hypothetical protein
LPFKPVQKGVKRTPLNTWPAFLFIPVNPKRSAQPSRCFKYERIGGRPRTTVRVGIGVEENVLSRREKETLYTQLRFVHLVQLLRRNTMYSLVSSMDACLFSYRVRAVNSGYVFSAQVRKQNARQLTTEASFSTRLFLQASRLQKPTSSINFDELCELYVGSYLNPAWKSDVHFSEGCTSKTWHSSSVAKLALYS